jgi:hypothetical protein
LTGSYCTMISAPMFVPQLKYHTQLLPLPNINYWDGARRTSWCKTSDGCILYAKQNRLSASNSSYFYLQFIWHSGDRASWYILIMKANKMHYFSNLFDRVLYMFQTCPLSIIRSISTLYTRNRYLSFQFCWHLLAWSGRNSTIIPSWPC